MRAKAILLYAAIGLTAVLALAAWIPLLPTGFWTVRLLDFLRLQLLALLVLPAVLTAVHGRLANWRPIHLGLFLTIAATAAWHTAKIVPYTPLWKVELSAATADGAEEAVSLLVSNLKKDNERHEAISNMLTAQSPDLLLLLEIDATWRSALEEVRESYPYRVEEIKGSGLGMVLWSRLPLQNAEIRFLVSERRPSIFADVVFDDGQILHFIGLHPTPPGLRDSTGDDRRNSRVRDAELVLAGRLVKAAANESWVVAGDLNDVAWSATTKLFRHVSGLRDPRIGRGLVNTYDQRSTFMRYPIDQLFLSAKTKIAKFHRVAAPGSDHFAIFAEFIPQRGKKPAPDAETRRRAEELLEEGTKDASKRRISDP